MIISHLYFNIKAINTYIINNHNEIAGAKQLMTTIHNLNPMILHYTIVKRYMDRFKFRLICKNS